MHRPAAVRAEAGSVDNAYRRIREEGGHGVGRLAA